MITLKDWVKKNVQRPLLLLLLVSVCCGAGYLGFISYSRYSEQYDRVDRVRDSISLGVQQSNRPLIEVALMSILDGETVVGAALCSGSAVYIAYPPESGSYCGLAGRGFLKWSIRKQLIGIQNYEFLAVFSVLSLLKPLAFLALAAVLIAAGALYSLSRIREGFRGEVLLPLRDGMSKTEHLAIFELEDLRRKNLDRIKLVSERASAAALVQLSAQVAHDIRSPLAALGAAAKGLEMPEEQRKLVEGAVGRMQGIADDLLQRYRAPSAAPTAAKTSICALGGFIEQVLSEKRLQHKDKAGLKIEFNSAGAEVKALAEPKELQRLLSNLVNNSVEAFAGSGTIVVSLSALDSKALIEVKDNGKGIPPEILAKLGQKGETHGKTGGTGLGLYHARTTVEGWGGSFKIGSELGKGTAVLIELPRAAASAGRLAVLLDDDMLVHMNWKLAAKAAGVELKAYKTREDFAAGTEALPKETPLYIDSDLGNDLKGEDIAKELHEKGFTTITMATGHGSEKFSHLPWLKVSGKEPPWA